MKKINLFYWICTILLSLFMIFSGIQGIIANPEGVKIIEGHLGYPHYFNVYLGVAKVLGAIIILVPGFPRLKEWAYAGIFIDLFSAMYSFIAVGDSPAAWAPVLLFLLLFAASYMLYQKRQKAMSATSLR